MSSKMNKQSKSKKPTFLTPETVIEEELKEYVKVAHEKGLKAIVFAEVPEDGETVSRWDAFPTFSDAWAWLARCVIARKPARCWQVIDENTWKEVKPI